MCVMMECRGTVLADEYEARRLEIVDVEAHSMYGSG